METARLEKVPTFGSEVLLRIGLQPAAIPLGGTPVLVDSAIGGVFAGGSDRSDRALNGMLTDWRLAEPIPASNAANLVSADHAISKAVHDAIFAELMNDLFGE